MYGTPAEETGIGKTCMLREGLFNKHADVGVFRVAIRKPLNFLTLIPEGQKAPKAIR